jgi:hypothetical protein
MTMRTAGRIALGFAAVSLLGACGRDPGAMRYLGGFFERQPPPVHAVHSKRLLRIMRGMRSADFVALPQELDPGAEQAREWRRLARNAAEVVRASEQIERLAPDLGLDEQEALEFRLQAKELRAAAWDLQQRAEVHDQEGAVAAMKLAEATCRACHSLFREP